MIHSKYVNYFKKKNSFYPYAGLFFSLPAIAVDAHLACNSIIFEKKEKIGLSFDENKVERLLIFD